MTDIQFEILTVLMGMMQDGCSKKEAVQYILLMDYELNDINEALGYL